MGIDCPAILATKKSVYILHEAVYIGQLVAYRKFCKITNFKRFLSQKFEIIRLVLHTISKKLTLSLQNFRYTAQFQKVEYILN